MKEPITKEMTDSIVSLLDDDRFLSYLEMIDDMARKCDEKVLKSADEGTIDVKSIEKAKAFRECASLVRNMGSAVRIRNRKADV